MQTFVGIDLEPENGRLLTALAPALVSVTVLQGSTRDQAVRDRLVRCLDGSALDILFIDGDHRYQGVRADFLEYRSLVRPGGLIAFHDIVPHRERPYELGAGGPWSGDVPRLWREMRDHFSHWELIDDPAQDGCGIGVIEHDPAVKL